MSRKRKLVKKSNIVDEEEQSKMDGSSLPRYLPEEIVFDNILTRLPVRDLAQNHNLVSKLWYDTIHDDKRFAASHFAHQNRNELKLVFDLFNVSKGKDSKENYFFSLEKDSRSDDQAFSFENFAGLVLGAPIEPVGNCNGLSCLKLVSLPSHAEGAITVINPVRGDRLTLTYPIPTSGGWGETCQHLCHGFGFDSLTQEYKVVVIYTINSDDDQEFICMVVTLGTKSWRKIVTRTSEISPPPASSPFLSRMVATTWKSIHKSATLCGDDCLWRITNTTDDGNDIHMLLSFNIHNEKIHFIRLPTETECATTALNTPAINEHMYSQVDHQLLEFKGYPCVSRFEKIMVRKRVRHRRHCIHQSSFCCNCLKVHLYTLKDKVKQVWIKEKTFDVRLKEEGLVPHPFCCDLDTATTRTPLTRILSFRDEVILYWFDGENLIFYNLEQKHLEVVKGTRSHDEKNQEIFVTKSYEVCIPYIDYQLHTQVENITSLMTFLPQGEVTKFHSLHKFKRFLKYKKPVGWVTTGKKSRIHYAFG